MTMRLRRSELATPASSVKMIQKAAASAADLVFLDLEDAVAPAQKVAARDNVVRALNELDWGTKLRAVRVNGAHTEWAYADTIAVVEGAGRNLDIVIVPKVKAPRDVWFFDTLLSSARAQAPSGEAHRPRGSDRGDRGARPRREDRRVLAAPRGAHSRLRRSRRESGHPVRTCGRTGPTLPGRSVALRPRTHDRRGARQRTRSN